jgi:hypothetical protein
MVLFEIHTGLLGILREGAVVEARVVVPEDLEAEINDAGSDTSLAGEDDRLGFWVGEATLCAIDLCQLFFRQEVIVGVHDSIKGYTFRGRDVSLIKETGETTI